MPQSRQHLSGSNRHEAIGQTLGPADASQTAEVSVYFKRAPIAAANMSRSQMHAARTAVLAPAFEALRSFAADHGLMVSYQNPARRLAKLQGSLENLQLAFGTKLYVKQHRGMLFRARSGGLTLPQTLCESVEAVLGLDTRPTASPKIAFPRAPEAAVAHLPNEIAALYGFPQTAGRGKGQCIAIIELGGGYTDADNKAAFDAMKLPVPVIVAVPVSGGLNTPGGTDGADGEVALDIQVAGGAAPGAKLAVYFAPNTDQGFVDAISAAVHDEANAPSVLSISWGSAESQWTEQAVASMTSAFADAASLNVTVCAASGDGLAIDGISDGSAHVDFPASSPYVLGCGGTKLQTSANKFVAETVWNSDGGGTGGGVSALFGLPDYQRNAKVPVSVSTKKAGRGVPDVASDADPNSGYLVFVGGQRQIIGGTSAAAPLWAGLIALLNESSGRPIGQPHDVLYANTSALRDITQGNNQAGAIGYVAGAGWDACTGLGSPDGAALAAVFDKTSLEV
jgi:kumamolisin